MGKATAPIFTHEPLLGVAQLTLAEAARDNPTNFGTVVTGDAEGTRIDLVRVQHTATSVAGMVRLFLWDGSNARLVKEVPVTAITPSSTVEAFSAEWRPSEPILLPNASWELRASTENAEVINVIAFGGHFA